MARPRPVSVEAAVGRRLWSRVSRRLSLPRVAIPTTMRIRTSRVAKRLGFAIAARMERVKLARKGVSVKMSRLRRRVQCYPAEPSPATSRARPGHRRQPDSRVGKKRGERQHQGSRVGKSVAKMFQRMPEWLQSRPQRCRPRNGQSPASRTARHQGRCNCQRRLGKAGHVSAGPEPKVAPTGATHAAGANHSRLPL